MTAADAPPLKTSPSLCGLVLAGGQSSRLGRDKALAMLGQRPLVAHVAARLNAATGSIAISANGDPRRFDFLGLAVIADEDGERIGPLGGILAGLRHFAIAAPGAAMVTAATDTPFFPEEIVEMLADASGGGRRIALAATAEGPHPVFAIWPAALGEVLERHIAAGGRRSVLGFIETQPHAEVHVPPVRLGDELVDPFFNINTPADLERAEALLQLSAEMAP